MPATKTNPEKCRAVTQLGLERDLEHTLPYYDKAIWPVDCFLLNSEGAAPLTQ
jgi:hypothetical protein